MKKINSQVPEEQKQSFREDTDLLNKFIKFSIEASDKIFIEIFGRERGGSMYHNNFFTIHKKNMSSFLNSLEEADKNLIYFYIIYL